MSFEEMVVAIIAIIGGLGFTGFLFWNVFSLIKQWINRKSGNQQLDPQFFKALGEFKRSTDRRLANLEAIVSDMEEGEQQSAELKQRKSMGEIEIEEEDIRSNNQENRSKKSQDDGNLRNMLSE
ncbi:hypothetical protein [Gracilimonas mengyeensis]|uniref:Uncharacterized protein n=1 Tax=Gracilimonas mengyeensis TaxID=1302730 RepID=A0A521CII2_9BACT|nr:hypothetical protein [Gracilimonas mengyeensis]SMO59238.1 hypothetical protein SAMN06265219_105198 [Gracilimonas mengyeensis]